MSDNSRSRVTITLGHSGQVVKRAGPALQSLYGDSKSVAGRKRSVKDRLGGVVDLTEQYNNKRIQANGSGFSRAASSDEDGLSKNDLRFKIMRKNTLKKSQIDVHQSDLDLQDMLSRSAQSSAVSITTRQHMPECNDLSKRVPVLRVVRDDRRHLPECSDVLKRFLEFRGDRQYMSEMRDPRQQMGETSDSREHVLKAKDVRPRMQELNSMSILGRMPSTTFPGSLTSIDTLKDSYSPWTLERLSQGSPDVPVRRRSPDVAVRHKSPDFAVRQRSPDVAVRRRSPDVVLRRRSPVVGLRRSPDVGLNTPRGYSPLRREEELHRRPPVRSYHDNRVGSYMSKDVHDFSRLVSSSSFIPAAGLPAEELHRRPPVRSYHDNRVGSYMSKDVHDFSRLVSSSSFIPAAGLPAVPARLMASVHAPPMPPFSLVQRSSYTVDDPPTVDSFLRSLGLEKYAINFKAEEVDMYALKQMGDNDLKELGVPMGPRKKLLLALQSRAKRQI